MEHKDRGQDGRGCFKSCLKGDRAVEGKTAIKEKKPYLDVNLSDSQSVMRTNNSFPEKAANNLNSRDDERSCGRPTGGFG